MLQNKSILISGASGLIASCFIDVLMRKNQDGLNCKVYALGRNVEKAKNRFSPYWESNLFDFISHDINTPLEMDTDTVDYVIHMASDTHPVAYATDPIGTVTTNIIGTYNMLDFTVEHKAVRFAFTSSLTSITVVILTPTQCALDIQKANAAVRHYARPIRSKRTSTS